MYFKQVFITCIKQVLSFTLVLVVKYLIFILGVNVEHINHIHGFHNLFRKKIGGIIVPINGTNGRNPLKVLDNCKVNCTR